MNVIAVPSIAALVFGAGMILLELIGVFAGHEDLEVAPAGLLMGGVLLGFGAWGLSNS